MSGRMGRTAETSSGPPIFGITTSVTIRWIGPSWRWLISSASAPCWASRIR
jgi:hypothetical protein